VCPLQLFKCSAKLPRKPQAEAPPAPAPTSARKTRSASFDMRASEEAKQLEAFQAHAKAADLAGAAIIDALTRRCPLDAETRRQLADLHVLALGFVLRALKTAGHDPEPRQALPVARYAAAPEALDLGDVSSVAAAVKAGAAAAAKAKAAAAGDKGKKRKASAEEEAAVLEEEEEEEEGSASESVAEALQVALSAWMAKRCGGSSLLLAGKSDTAARVAEEALERHPCLARAALLADLPAHAEGAKTPFLRSEAFRLLALAFKAAKDGSPANKAAKGGARKGGKSKNIKGGNGGEEEKGAEPPLSAAGAAALQAAAPRALEAICGAMEAFLEAGAAGAASKEPSNGAGGGGEKSGASAGARAKRLRPALDCALEVLSACPDLLSVGKGPGPPLASRLGSLAAQVGGASKAQAVAQACKRIAAEFGTEGSGAKTEAESQAKAGGGKPLGGNKKRRSGEGSKEGSDAPVSETKAVSKSKDPEAVASVATPKAKRTKTPSKSSHKKANT